MDGVLAVMVRILFGDLFDAAMWVILVGSVAGGAYVATARLAWDRDMLPFTVAVLFFVVLCAAGGAYGLVAL